MTPHAHTSPPPEPRWEGWLSAPNTAAAEIVRDLGYGSVVLDIEHGAYSRTDADFADLRSVADAARRAGKPWVLPAWAQAEKEFALAHEADPVVLVADHAALVAGFGAALSETNAIIQRETE